MKVAAYGEGFSSSCSHRIFLTVQRGCVAAQCCPSNCCCEHFCSSRPPKQALHCICSFAILMQLALEHLLAPTPPPPPPPPPLLFPHQWGYGTNTSPPESIGIAGTVAPSRTKHQRCWRLPMQPSLGQPALTGARHTEAVHPVTSGHWAAAFMSCSQVSSPVCLPLPSKCMRELSTLMYRLATVQICWAATSNLRYAPIHRSSIRSMLKFGGMCLALRMFCIRAVGYPAATCAVENWVLLNGV